MRIIPFLHFFAFTTYVWLGIFILRKDPHSSLNRAGAFFLMLFAVWSFAAGFAQDPLISSREAGIWYSIGSIGWTGFGPAFLWFAILLTEKRRLSGLVPIRFALIVFPLILIYQQWAGNLLAAYVKEPYGWSYTWSPSLWPYAFSLFYLTAMGISLWMLIDYRRKTTVSVKRKQAGILILTIPPAVILGTASNFIQQRLGIHTFPPLADVVCGLIWALGVVSAMVRYRFFSITPASTAEDIIATLSDILVVVDAEGRVVIANGAACDALGYSAAEMRGMPVERICASGNAVFRKSASSGNQRISHEETLTAKDGRPIPCLVSTALLTDGAGAVAGAVCIAKDITAFKKAVDDLSFKTSLLEAQAEAALDGVLIIGPDGKVILHNERFGRMWDIPRELLEAGDDDAMLRHVLPQIHDPKGYLVKVRYLYEHTDKRSREEIELKDGKVFDRYSAPFLDAAGAYRGRIWYFRDITDKKRLMRALEDGQRKLRAVFDQSFQLMGVLAPDGTILEANRTALDFCGVDARMVIGRPFWETPWWIHSPQMQEKLRTAITRAAGGEANGFIATHVAKDGTLHTMDFSLKPAMDSAGRVLFLIPESRDITHAQRAEEMSEQLRRQIEYIRDATKTRIYIIDADYTMRYIDGGWGKLYGAYTGKKCYEYLMDRRTPCAYCNALSALQMKKPLVMEGVLPKEGNRAVQVTSTPFQDMNGHWMIAEVNVDISERKKMESELERRLQDLEKFNRFAVGRELRMMELKNRVKELEEKLGQR